MANPGTRFNKVVSVGAPLASFAALGASVMLYIFGSFTLHGVQRFEGVPMQFTQTGSDSSTVITSLKEDVKPMVATGATAASGANGKYRQFQWSNPLTQTASVLSFCLDIGTVPAPATKTSCYVLNDSITTTTGGLKLFSSVTLSKRGSLCYHTQNTSSSGSWISNFTVGPTEQIVCSNSLGSGSGQGLVGDGMVLYRSMRF